MKFLERTDVEDLFTSFTGDAVHLESVEGFSIAASWTDDTPTDKTFAAAAVNTSTKRITVTSHGFYTGLKVQVSNPGTLPVGVSAVTDYYVIAVDANTIKLATSYANAIAGTPVVDLTGQGVGTNTIEVQDSLTGVLKLQASNNAFSDNVNNNEDPNAVWVDIPGSSVAVAGAGTQIWNVSDVYYKAVRQVYTATVGDGSYTAYVYGKGTY